MRSPMAIGAAAFAAGIALAPLTAYNMPAAGAMALLALVGALLAIKKAWRKAGVPVTFATLFLALGMVAGSLSRPDPIPDAAKHPRVSLHLLSTTYTNYGILCNADLEGRKGKVKVTLPASCTVRPGDVVSIPNTLRPLPERGNYRHTLRYYDNLRRQGYIATANVFSYKSVVNTGHRDTPSTLLRRYRDHLAILIDKSQLDPGATALSEAMLLADRDALNPDDRDNFSQAGIAHILAVSGLHVGLLTSLLWILSAPLALTVRPWIRWTSMISVLWLFALLTGMSPSVVRATIMASALLLSLCMGRRQNPVNALGVAVLLILLFDPNALFEAGFQLSVAATAALILLAPKLNPVDPSRHNVLSHVLSVVMVTLIATAATWALTAWHFGKLPLWFVPSNVVTSLLTPVFMVVAALHLLLLCLGLDPLWLCRLVEWTHEGIAGTARLASAQHIPIYIEESTLVLWLAVMVIVLALWDHMAFSSDPARGGKMRRIVMPALLWGSVVVLAAGSIADAAAGPKVYDTGLIIQRQPDAMALSIYDGGKERIETLSAGECTALTAASRSILAVDADLKSLGTDILPENSSPHILLIGKNFRGDVEEVAERVKPRLVVLSSGIYKKRSAKMKEVLQESGIPVHDLRDSPLWLF